MIIKGASVFCEDGTFQVKDVFVEDHKIVATEAEVSDKTVVDANGYKLIPGLVDVHSHGACGHDFCDCDVEGVKEILRFEKAHGITSYCPTSMTLSKEMLVDIFATAKEADEIKETHLLSIEWSPSRTGLINPVAIFEPVELEGTTVSRASVHNLSIMKTLQLGIGDTIQVYKANMIIPQIAENLTRSGNMEIPQTCPVCGGVTRIQRTADVETLYCTNPECQAKKIKSFALFVSRDAMNMEGMSEATLEKFIGSGFIHEFADIFRLSRYKDAIVEMEGFGEKSYEKLMAGIGQARNTTLPRLIYSLGIPNIGVANAKMICKAFDYDLEKIRTADAETMAGIDGIGEVIGAAVADYFRDAKKAEQLDDLLEEIHLEKYVPNETEQIFAGKNFVITGSLIHFANRNELKAKIEEKGGKVTGSVTSKTDYLINNDTQSSTSKNKKAKELEIPVISEEDFLGMLEQR